MQGFITFIIIFGILVLIHELGHFYFAKRAGILVREFAIGMGPKLFAHQGKDGTLYTLRALPLGGYVRMAGWGEDKTEIRTGTLASLSLAPDGQVVRINLSDQSLDPAALPLEVTSYDLEDSLEITGLVQGQSQTYTVAHDATIVEEDGTEVRIAPLDVQYQNASVLGRMMTNFAGPMNNFILGAVLFTLLVFLQGGVRNYETNQVQVAEGGALATAGVSGQVTVLSVNGRAVTDWESLSEAVQAAGQEAQTSGQVTVELADQGKVAIAPKKDGDRYLIGVLPSMKTGLVDKLVGGLKMTWDSAFAIINALKGLILKPDMSKLGGPIAIYQMSTSAAKEGLVAILSLMGMLSINLGIFNLLPIPALDGGKIVLNILEGIRKKPLKQETEGYITLAGVAVMLLLMIATTWNDIVRTFF